MRERQQYWALDKDPIVPWDEEDKLALHEGNEDMFNKPVYEKGSIEDRHHKLQAKIGNAWSMNIGDEASVMVPNKYVDKVIEHLKASGDAVNIKSVPSKHKEGMSAVQYKLAPKGKVKPIAFPEQDESTGGITIEAPHQEKGIDVPGVHSQPHDRIKYDPFSKSYAARRKRGKIQRT